MSDVSSENSPTALQAEPEPQRRPAAKTWGVLSGTMWAVVAFLGPQFLVGPLVPTISSLAVSQNTKLFLLQGFVELITLGGLLLIIRSYGQNLRSIGIGRFELRHVGLALLFFPIYLALSMILLGVSRLIFPDVNLDQRQEIGFTGVQGIELALVFISLVVIPPIVEELVFRGFLFKAYGRRFGFILGSVLVSVLFGLAHGQLNVGIDVFALSLCLCYLRIKTDSLWPSILLHATKNFVAFFILFIIGVS